MVFGKSRSILLVATLQYCLSFSPPTWAPTCLSCSVRQGKATLARKADASQPASHGFQDISSPLDFSSASSKNLPLKPFLIGSTALYASPNIEDDEPTAELSMARRGTGRRGNDVGGFDPLKDKLPQKRDTVVVGEPQKVKTESMNIEKVLAELQAIQSQGSKKYCILGTRHCSFLHQQIIEMLAYALVLSGNHIYTSGAQGTNAAAIRGALRAIKPHLLTVVLPQSMSKQTPESQELLQDVTNVVTMPQNDGMPLDMASRICNSHLLNQTDHLISFAFHESKTVIEASREAQKLNLLVTMLYLD